MGGIQEVSQLRCRVPEEVLCRQLLLQTPEDMPENGLVSMALCVSVCVRDGFQFQPSLYCFAEFVEF